jgi:hypothetical protein
LEVRYEVYAFDNSVRTAWLNDVRGFFNATSLCLMVQDQTDRPHALELARGQDMKGWQVATGLMPQRVDAAGFGSYLAADYDELADCPVEMGAFWSGEFMACGVAHRFVVAGALPSMDGDRLMRDVQKIVATDQDDRALTCAKENIALLGLGSQIEIVKANLFPTGKASLIVCNPPWVPARPSSTLEHAVYDPDSQMLKGFLSGLKDHLLPQGEGWLILSDLAEHLELRSRQELLSWIEDAGLAVLDRIDTKPKHPKAFDSSDSLHFARAAETTSLWRLHIHQKY